MADEFHFFSLIINNFDENLRGAVTFSPLNRLTPGWN